MTSEITDTTESGGARRILYRRGCALRRRLAAAADGLPLILLPSAAIAFRNPFADWVFMWLLAFSIYFGCKWLTWRRADRTGVGVLRSLAYLLVWPGMDAREFLTRRPRRQVAVADWARAFAKTLLGAGLFGLAISGNGSPDTLVAGWIGMAGAILLLHFGVFHLLALGFNAAGIAAKPLMCRPASAMSLAEFWGRRWNTAFHKLVRDFIFRPISRRAGALWAMLSVFLVSGLVHDLVISVPARAGYGKPTAYFLLQGAAVLFERGRAGSALGLGRGWRGRIFVCAVTCLPLGWLFHEPFVRNVILPMLAVVGGWRAL